MKEPEVKQTIKINDKVYEFDGIPSAPQFVYAEPGRKAKVYRVKNKHLNRVAALKVFYQEFRGPTFDSHLVQKTSQLTQYVNKIFPTDALKRNAGLSSAKRELVLPDRNKELLTKSPHFSHSILMEWFDGNSWTNYIIDKTPMTRTNSLKLSNTLGNVLVNLEKNGLAHCDLAGGNFVFSSDLTRIELIDIEDVYFPGTIAPSPLPAGTEGYVPYWVKKKGLWNPLADRIAGAILLVEIIVWQFEDVRKIRSGQTFFDSKEFGVKTDRYMTVFAYLKKCNLGLATLFDAVWNCKSAEDCPSLLTWKECLEKI